MSSAAPSPSNRSRARRLFGRAAWLLAGLISTGVSYQSIGTARDVRAYPPPGRLIDVGGHRLHLNCTGAGGPTVILEAGLGSTSVSWTWIQPALAKATRVCSYDRAGYGWSDPGPAERTAATIAAELHQLLTTAGERGPYVLVAHSFGGIPARVFAGRYPAEVVGVVLVDASHPAQFSAACRPACLPHQVVARTASLYATMRWVAPSGALRLGSRVGLLPFGEATAGLPDRESDVMAAAFVSTRYWKTSRDEFRALPASTAQAIDAGPLGDRPLRVVTAGHTYYTKEIQAFTGDVDADRVTASWLALQQDLTTLSSRSAQTIVREASHVSLLTDHRFAPFVVDAVRDVLREVAR